MSSTQVNAFIDTDTQVDAMRSGTGTVYVNIDSLTCATTPASRTPRGSCAGSSRRPSTSGLLALFWIGGGR